MSPTIGVVPLTMLVSAAIVYGLIFPFNAIAAAEGAHHLGHAFWQTLLGGGSLYLVCLASGRRVSFGWRYLRAYVTVGLFGFGLPMALFTYVSPHLPTGLVSLVLALSPTFTYLASVLLRLDRLSLFGLAGIALGFAGVALVLAPESALPTPEAFGWFLLVLVIPLLLAVANVSAALLRPPATGSLVMGAGFLIGAALSLLPATLATGQLHSPLAGGLLLPTLGAAAVNAVFILLFAEIVRRYGPTFFAQFNYLAVIAAMGWAALFFGEVPSLYALLALALMAAGVLVTEMRHRGAAGAGR